MDVLTHVECPAVQHVWEPAREVVHPHVLKPVREAVKILAVRVARQIARIRVKQSLRREIQYVKRRIRFRKSEASNLYRYEGLPVSL